VIAVLHSDFDLSKQPLKHGMRSMYIKRSGDLYD